MGYVASGRYIQVRSGNTRLQIEIGKELEIAYERRFGRRFTHSRFNGDLSTTEQEWLITKASKTVQSRRGRESNTSSKQ